MKQNDPERKDNTMLQRLTETQQRCLELADIIETNINSNHKFDMDTWFKKTECGTIGCIAGTAVLHFDPTFVLKHCYNTSNEVNQQTNICIRARELLGLTNIESADLFTPLEDIDYNEITPQLAATVIRRFVETGLIEWKVK